MKKSKPKNKAPKVASYDMKKNYMKEANSGGGKQPTKKK